MTSIVRFDDFFRREFPVLVAFLRKAGFTREQAEEAASEAMTALYTSWPRITLSHRAWVRKAAYRIACKQAQRVREAPGRAAAAGWGNVVSNDTDVVLMKEECNDILQLLENLPPRQRLVMAWHLDGFNNKEISGQLNMPLATVRSTFRQARNKLREAYEVRHNNNEGEGGSHDRR